MKIRVNEYFSNYPDLYDKEFDLNLIPQKYINDNITPFSELRKDVIVIMFFDGTCPGCYNELSLLQEFILSSRYSDQTSLIGVAVGKPKNWLTKIINDEKIVCPVIIDPLSEFFQKSGLLHYGMGIYVLTSDFRVRLVGDIVNDDFLKSYFFELYDKK